MLYSEKISLAIRFSIKTHEVYQKQKRKGKDIPYITHPLTVGLILARANVSEDVVVAGILHDTIEDSTKEKKVTRDMIAERFGEHVATLVASVSESDKALSWSERKQEALDHIDTFSNESVLVKSADVLANTRELLEDYGRDGDVIFERFASSKERHVQNALDVMSKLLSRWPESPLAEDIRMSRSVLSTLLGENA